MTTVDERLALAAAALGVSDEVDRLANVLDHLVVDESAIWLVLSSALARIVAVSEVIEARRDLALHGGERWLRQLRARGRAVKDTVEILTGHTVVDVHDAVASARRAGAVRVARELAAHWVDTATLVGWDEDRWVLRRCDLEGAWVGHLLLPWRCTFIVPEIADARGRVDATRAIAVYGRGTTAAIGFDCIPITTAEMVPPGVGGSFPNYLAMLAQFDLILPVSQAAATEFRGWRAMLGSADITGPHLIPVALPCDVPTLTEAEVRAVWHELLHDDPRPVLLSVGTHEPRKNQLAVLHAAEMLSQTGRAFQVIFVGGETDWSVPFLNELERLQRDRVPVRDLGAVDDRALFALYRLATATVFPSWNEGFGLPIVESLMSGTPVVTSFFGAMAEAAAPGGALFVDPADDWAIIRALDAVLFDASTRARLTAEMADLPRSTWADYADAVLAAIRTHVSNSERGTREGGSQPLVAG